MVVSLRYGGVAAKPALVATTFDGRGALTAAPSRGQRDNGSTSYSHTTDEYTTRNPLRIIVSDLDTLFHS